MNIIAVIDYGMGNLHSIAKAMERVAGESRVIVSYDPDEVYRADKVVFPGVGAIRYCIDELNRLGLDAAIHQAAISKPMLAICVGMQALMTQSEENGGVGCLGILPGQVQRFTDTSVKVPHMGWNHVNQQQAHPMWADIPDGERFYFVHSYYVSTTDDTLVQATSTHPHPFHSALARDNLFAVQFHPEKSQQAGLTLLKNFCAWDGQS